MVYPVQVDLEGDVGGSVIAVELPFNRLRNREVHGDGYPVQAAKIERTSSLACNSLSD